MAGLRATGWLPPACALHQTVPQSCACVHTLATPRLAGPASPAAPGCWLAHASSSTGRGYQHSSTGRPFRTVSAGAVLRSASSVSTQAVRTAHAGRQGSDSPSYSGQPEEPRQQMSKPQPAAERQSPAEARAEAFEHAVPEAFFLKGVSFDERQQNIEAIQKGTPLLLHQEKTNPVDPNAVEVLSLHGHRLGYVPRGMTGSYAYEWGLAYVEGKGEAGDSGLTGVKVAAYPTLLPATVDAMPENLVRHTRLSKVLPAADWDRLRTAAYQRAKYRCEITGGAGEEQPVNATGLWMAHEDKKVLQLYGVIALAPSVARLKNLGAVEDRLTAVQELCAINRWSEEDAEAYLKHIDVVRMLRAREDWRLELGWLSTQGVAVPAALRPLCYAE